MRCLARQNTNQPGAHHWESEAVLALSMARVLDSQSTVTETAKKLRRTRDLIKRKLASSEELDTASASYSRAAALLAVAQVQVAQAQAQLDAETRALEKADIRAPIDGIVGEGQLLRL